MVQSLRRSVALSLCLAVCLSLYGLMERAADAARLKDLTSIAGVRDNQLIGYGLVVGLNGSGDGNNTGFSSQTLSTMLRSMGLTIDAAKIRARNAAVAMVRPPCHRLPGLAARSMSWSHPWAMRRVCRGAHYSSPPSVLPMARSMPWPRGQCP